MPSRRWLARYISTAALVAARSFTIKQAREQLATVHQQPPLEINPKGRLQEILQALPPLGENAHSTPRNPSYTIVAQVGPDHAKTFTAEVVWNGLTLGRGVGGSKQLAESAAAIDALTAREAGKAMTRVRLPTLMIAPLLPMAAAKTDSGND